MKPKVHYRVHRKALQDSLLTQINPFDTRPYHFAWQIEYLNSGKIMFHAFPPGGRIYACIGQITRSQNPEEGNASLLILSFHQSFCVQIRPYPAVITNKRVCGWLYQINTHKCTHILVNHHFISTICNSMFQPLKVQLQGI